MSDRPVKIVSWQVAAAVLLAFVAWGACEFALEVHLGWPQRYGFPHEGIGRGQYVADLFHSPVLLRGGPLEYLLFLSMWAPVACAVYWSLNRWLGPPRPAHPLTPSDPE